MEFTYKAYSKLLELLRAHHYSFCNYQNYRDFDRCVIMRHDIDYNIEFLTKYLSEKGADWERHGSSHNEAAINNSEQVTK